MYSFPCKQGGLNRSLPILLHILVLILIIISRVELLSKSFSFFAIEDILVSFASLRGTYCWLLPLLPIRLGELRRLPLILPEVAVEVSQLVTPATPETPETEIP